jgi:hypothetical protein
MRALGPGLPESVYRRCLMHELGLRGLDVYAEYPIPIRYKEVVLARISHKTSTAAAYPAGSTALHSLRLLDVRKVRLRGLRSQALYLQPPTPPRYEPL